MDTEHNPFTLENAPTLARAFHARVQQTPGAVAYSDFRDGRWTDFTWEKTKQAVAAWQQAMLDDGLRAGDRIVIMCANNWDWVVCDQAAQGLGLVTVPVYTNDRAENIAWILEDSGARWLMVQGAAQWETLESIHPTLSLLVRIVTLEAVSPALDNVQTVESWLDSAQAGQLAPVYEMGPVNPNALATIVYTSGTTGRPKGVMLSHYNILWNIHAALDVVAVYPDDTLLSFLPLSHTLERTAGYYLPIISGSRVAFSRGIPKLADDLVAIQPTLMISVPRIFERVYARITGRIASESGLKRYLFESAVALGWRRFEMQQKRASWTPGLILFPLLDHLVGRKVRARLGGRLRFTVCGGAALNEDVAKLFIGLGVPILQGYGLTETSPVISANRLEDNLPYSVGAALPGVEVSIGEQDELLTRSPSVMMGYWNNDQGTRAIIDEQGWLHTGDRVEIDKQGHIHIIGRIKEIIVLSNGEKMPPADMENAIALDDLVEQVLVIGEGRPYLVALVVPSEEVLQRIAGELDLDLNEPASIHDARLRKMLLKRIEARTESFPGFARIRQAALITEPWSPDNGFMTPTLKLRRNRILEQCQDEVERLYAGH